MASPYQIVLDAAIEQAKEQKVFQEGDDNLLALDTYRAMNMTMGGRPSDHARSVSRAYLANPVKFREDFKTTRERYRV
jgi:hypothetical protein